MWFSPAPAWCSPALVWCSPALYDQTQSNLASCWCNHRVNTLFLSSERRGVRVSPSCGSVRDVIVDGQIDTSGLCRSLKQKLFSIHCRCLWMSFLRLVSVCTSSSTWIVLQILSWTSSRVLWSLSVTPVIRRRLCACVSRSCLCLRPLAPFLPHPSACFTVWCSQEWSWGCHRSDW